MRAAKYVTVRGSIPEYNPQPIARTHTERFTLGMLWRMLFK